MIRKGTGEVPFIPSPAWCLWPKASAFLLPTLKETSAEIPEDFCISFYCSVASRRIQWTHLACWTKTPPRSQNLTKCLANIISEDNSFCILYICASIILSTWINFRLQRTLKELTPVFAAKMAFKGKEWKALISSTGFCGADTSTGIDFSVFS